METEKSREKLVGFLRKFFKVNQIDDNSDIFALGYVNSLFAMQFVMFIEKEFDIAVDPADMNIENFNTIAHMIAFIQRKQAVIL